MGRRILWVFVAMVGFFCGRQIGADMSDASTLLISIGTGAIGALLGVVLQRFAVLLAGAVIGGILAVRVAPIFELHTNAGLMAAFISGALLALGMLAGFFESSLVVLSAITGAVMIAEALPIDPVLMPLLLIVLVLFGVFIQFRVAAPDHN
jgi:hypothetical protein